MSQSLVPPTPCPPSRSFRANALLSDYRPAVEGVGAAGIDENAGAGHTSSSSSSSSSGDVGFTLRVPAVGQAPIRRVVLRVGTQEAPLGLDTDESYEITVRRELWTPPREG